MLGRIECSRPKEKLDAQLLSRQTLAFKHRALLARLLLQKAALQIACARHKEALALLHEATDFARQSLTKLLLICLMSFERMEKLKRVRINKLYKLDEHYLFSSKDYDLLLEEGLKAAGSFLTKSTATKDFDAIRAQYSDSIRLKLNQHFSKEEWADFIAIRIILPIVIKIREKYELLFPEL